MKKKEEHELLNKTPSVKELEEQRRREGLEKAIDSNNKGFSLLQKMGYKPGSGIGKNSKFSRAIVFQCQLNLFIEHREYPGKKSLKTLNLH